MFWKKKNKVDLSRIAFFDGKRELTYARFSSDIATTAAYLEKELEASCTLVAISPAVGPYLHWVLHAACTIRGVATLAIRSGQKISKDILVLGPADATSDLSFLPYDYTVLNGARVKQVDDKGKGFNQFVKVLTAKKSTINRIILTSGSTGQPKAVPLTNAVVMARRELTTKQLPLKPDDKVLWSLGYDTAGGFNGPIEALLAGATVLLNLRSNDRETFALLLRQSTRLITVPSLLAVLLEHVSQPIEGADRRLVMTTGSRIEPKIAARCKDLLAADVRSFYGSTEVGAISEIGAEKLDGESGNVGPLYRGVQLAFDDENDAKSTEVSEGPFTCRPLKFKTPWMAAGYWDNGTVTPFTDGWFRPGDVGFLNQNNELVIASRSDDVLNYNGEKMDALAVESRLRALAGVDDAFITVSKFRGRDSLVVMAVSSLDQQALQSQLTNALAPKAFNLIQAQRIPRNHMGKIERTRLTRYCQKLLEDSMAGHANKMQ